MTLNEQTAETVGLHFNVTRRLLALDIGDVRTGVAISDSTNALAGPAAVLTARNKESLLAEIESFIETYSARVAKELAFESSTETPKTNATESVTNTVINNDESYIKRAGDHLQLAANDLFECVVIGLPLDQFGNETARAAKVREWGEFVAASVELSVAFVDERYTTRRMLTADKASKRRVKDGRANIDARAAAEILQSYIDAKRFTKSFVDAENTKHDEADET